MKISSIFNIEKGVLQSSKCIEGEYDFITASSDWKKHNNFTHDCEALIFAMGASGSLGRTHYVKGKFIASDLCFILTPRDEFLDLIDLELYQFFFNLNKSKIVKDLATGTSKIAINRKRFSEYEVPLISSANLNLEDVRDRLKKSEILIQDLNRSTKSLIQDLSEFRQEILSRLLQDQNVSSENKFYSFSEFLTRNRRQIAIADDIEYKQVTVKLWGKGLSLRKRTRGKEIGMKNQFLVKESDFVMSTIDARQGAFGLVDKSLDNAIITVHFWSFKVDESIVSRDWFNLFVSSNEFIEKCKEASFGSTNRKALSLKTFLEMKVNIPPLAEQRRIVEKIEAIFAQLDVMEEAIRLQKDEASKCYEEILRKSLEGNAGNEPKHQEEKELVSIGSGIGLKLTDLRNANNKE